MYTCVEPYWSHAVLAMTMTHPIIMGGIPLIRGIFLRYAHVYSQRHSFSVHPNGVSGSQLEVLQLVAACLLLERVQELVALPVLFEGQPTL